MRNVLSRTAIAAATAALLCFGAAGSAAAAAYSGLYVFGDSLSDVGNIYAASGGTEPVSPPYSQGRFTNGNVWAQDLSSALGLGPVTPSVAGGNDFAFGGAQTGPTNANAYNTSNPGYPTNTQIDLPAQLNAFNAATNNGINAQSGALYTLWIGSNDLNALLSAVVDGSKAPTTANTTADLGQAISNIDSFASGLATDGMKNLLALNVPDLSKTPLAQALTHGDTTLLAELSSITNQFNTALAQSLTSLAQADNFSLTQVNIFSAMDQVVANPSAYGLTNVTNACWTGSFTSASSGTVCSNPGQYLFWDQLHPTAAAHQIVANVALATLVPEPGSAALLLAGVAGIALIRRRRRC